MTLDQDALRKLWLEAPEDRLCAWEVAKALGLREASKELHGQVRHTQHNFGTQRPPRLEHSAYKCRHVQAQFVHIEIHSDSAALLGTAVYCSKTQKTQTQSTHAPEAYIILGRVWEKGGTVQDIGQFAGINGLRGWHIQVINAGTFRHIRAHSDSTAPLGAAFYCGETQTSRHIQRMHP